MKLAAQIILPIILILFALFGFKMLAASRKAKTSQVPVKVVPQAEIVTVSPADHSPPVLSYGTVQSHFETTLTPQVSGRIVAVAPEFRVGRLVEKGAELARIDDTDYVAAKAREVSNLSTAKRTLAEEEIRARQAVEDWEASGRAKAKASDFVLRKPQLKAAEASILSAKAAVTKADEDIKRTIIRAPYKAVVMVRTASEGNFASQQQSLGVLVATERVEIRLPLTADQAARVELPGLVADAKSDVKKGGKEGVTLTSSARPGLKWQGELARTEPAVDAKNQVTYVIVEVKNPYTTQAQPLAIGTFVNASLPAKVIPGAYQLAESALVNDSFVWALDKDNRLLMLPAKRVYSYAGDVFLSLTLDAINPPLRIVSRPLTNFKEGVKVDPLVDPLVEPLVK
jgi:RND family efflux transporter MFP subunit